MKYLKFSCLTFVFVMFLHTNTIAQSVTIGTQVWMTKNLDVTKFRNGDLIPQAKTNDEWEQAGKNKQPAWCYYANNKKNGKKYGKLYNWYAVSDPRGLAPDGWHVPSDAEWTVLSNYIGGEDVAGKKMKSTSGWEGFDGGTNESGFSGLPGGYRYSFGNFGNLGVSGYWWSSTEGSPSSAYDLYLDHSLNYLVRSGSVKGGGLSVRCLKD
jgi:uncharacterized protein (TIGR02145 family)